MAQPLPVAAELFPIDMLGDAGAISGHFLPAEAASEIRHPNIPALVLIEIRHVIRAPSSAPSSARHPRLRSKRAARASPFPSHCERKAASYRERGTNSDAVRRPICDVTTTHQPSLASEAASSVDTGARRFFQNNGESATSVSSSACTREEMRATTGWLADCGGYILYGDSSGTAYSRYGFQWYRTFQKGIPMVPHIL